MTPDLPYANKGQLSGFLAHAQVNLSLLVRGVESIEIGEDAEGTFLLWNVRQVSLAEDYSDGRPYGIKEAIDMFQWWCVDTHRHVRARIRLGWV